MKLQCDDCKANSEDIDPRGFYLVEVNTTKSWYGGSEKILCSLCIGNWIKDDMAENSIIVAYRILPEIDFKQ